MRVRDAVRRAQTTPNQARVSEAPALTARGVNLDIARILRILPHRPPLLFIDRVIDIDPRKSARAIKCVSVNEPVLQGHFPGEPVFPAVLCVEAMSQLMCILLYASRVIETSSQRFAFAGVEKAKFRQAILPGDRIDLAITVVNHRSNIWKCAGTASVDDVLCVEAELLAAIQDGDET
jgi:3-hydroxyacyl-[acyl-carrier-protein] dehydratase